MMKRSCWLFAGVVLLSTPLPVAAQNSAPAYSRNEVIKNLLDQKSTMGRPRSVCIGVNSECADEPKDPQGFDMLLTFDFGSATLTEESKKNLDIVSDALHDSEFSGAKFLIEGHTDAKGTDQFNLNLSNERATVVMKYLRGKNISPDRLLALGLGETRPRTADGDAAENRRVELKLLKN
jgi:outer membrane protein OmpA-like peptidoglycan-associated protein